MSNYRFETLQLHVGQEQADPATDSRAVPIYQTTSYVFHDSKDAADRFALRAGGNVYGRITNTTQGVLEQRLAALEGGSAALAVASGAAAIDYTIQALATKGDHIVAQKTIYGGSFNLLNNTLPLYGIDTTFVDAHNLEEVEAAIKPNTKAVYLETLGNPGSDIPDIDAISEIAHKHGLPVVVDNTFGTPYLIRPFEHGADINARDSEGQSALFYRTRRRRQITHKNVRKLGKLLFVRQNIRGKGAIKTPGATKRNANINAYCALVALLQNRLLPKGDVRHKVGFFVAYGILAPKSIDYLRGVKPRLYKAVPDRLFIFFYYSQFYIFRCKHFAPPFY